VFDRVKREIIVQIVLFFKMMVLLLSVEHHPNGAAAPLADKVVERVHLLLVLGTLLLGQTGLCSVVHMGEGVAPHVHMRLALKVEASRLLNITLLALTVTAAAGAGRGGDTAAAAAAAHGVKGSVGSVVKVSRRWAIAAASHRGSAETSPGAAAASGACCAERSCSGSPATSCGIS